MLPTGDVLVISRVLVVLLGGFALMQAAYWESILAMALYAYTIYSAAITPVVMAAFFWRRATAAAAVVSIALGTVVTIGWNLERGSLPPVLAQLDAVYPALIVSVAALWLLSYLTPAPSSAQLAPFFATGAPEA